MNPLTQRAKQMMEKPNFAKFIGNNKIKIRSQTDLSKSYIVSTTDNGLICQCKDHTTRNADCEHIKVSL